jgi:dTDP-4-dehydrorhamnose reductase
MHFTVIGDRGMFGQEMYSLLQSAGETVSGFNRSTIDLSRSPQELADDIEKAEVIVNAVAFTGVDAAESRVDEARLVNGEYVGKLAQVALILDAKLMHVSTDYVFNGTALNPIKTQANTEPVNEYGFSKLLGEQLLSKSGARYQVFRTAWLYGASGNCFPKAVAKRLLEKGSCDVVSNQFGQPTWAKDLAEIVYRHSVEDFDEPVVHAVSSGSASWFEFAKEIASLLPNPDSYSVNPIPGSDLVREAKRPSYGVLDNTETVGPVIGNWLERWKIASPGVLSSIK